MLKDKIKQFNKKKVLILITIILIVINRIIKNDNLLNITLVFYILLVIYKISTALFYFYNSYNKKDNIKVNVILFLKKHNPAFYEILNQEILILYYALYIWKKKQRPNNCFNSYHKNPNITLYIGFLFLLLTETIIADVLLIKFSLFLLAKISILSSIYLIILFLAHIKALKFRLTCFSTEHLIIRHGIMSEVKLPYNMIKLNNDDDSKSNIISFGLMSKIETNNVFIYFEKPMSISRLYGIKKSGNGMSFYVSEEKKFIDLLSENINRSQTVNPKKLESNV